jgi:hypothetical protein
MAELLEILIYVFQFVADALWFFVLRRERRWDEEPGRWKRLGQARRDRILARRARWRKRRSGRSGA